MAPLTLILAGLDSVQLVTLNVIVGESTVSPSNASTPLECRGRSLGTPKGQVVVAVKVVVVASSTVEKNVVVAIDATTTVETEVIVCSLTLPTR